ncbi:MAG TPA: hypothetical protein VJ654_00665 [Noviherbaspirillum sp.]|nr:hypothetical protein [Noviherbaspirillum sp.]
MNTEQIRADRGETEQALNKAREAVKTLRKFWRGSYWNAVTSKECEEIRAAFETLAALAQPAQEPICYARADKEGNIIWGEDCVCVDPVFPSHDFDEDDDGEPTISLPLFTRPQPTAPVAPAERHVLTDADRETLLGLIAWLRGAAQGDRPNTTRGEAADTLQRILSTAPQVEAKEGEQHVWIAYNSEDDDEPVMFFTEMPGQELKDRFFLKHYICRPAAPSSQKEGAQPT